MRRLITAEFHKLATTRLWLWLLLGSVALMGAVGSVPFSLGRLGSGSGQQVSTLVARHAMPRVRPCPGWSRGGLDH